MKGIMIQGTASNVGKSLVVTAVCRMLVNEGLSVAPFKSQNMSNYVQVLQDGLEISRAQALQAEAAKVDPTVWMNPIVLKPSSDLKAEVVMLGKTKKTLTGRDYRNSFYETGLAVIKDSLHHLNQQYDVLVMEGAGSPVELNLKNNELVNMKIAELADVPVLLIADIDRGGVFASIIGTLELLSHPERKRVKGIIINKFRGDQSLFAEGIRWIEKNTRLPVLGIIPHIHHTIEREDSYGTEGQVPCPEPPVSTAVDRYDDLAAQIKNHLDWEHMINIINQWDRQ
ncbi:cobyric acid synthase CobQ [Virgibacillus phasianinus]|uniref:Cobyric acid synthase n=1 Tax=Virgibacillus phasianinus TaxID=2017483 RepID=A0A220U252_9BACI|nr:cobyric acid synthase [Virgibacillus phasianinus]ASK61853.1 cobyric acid synthase CobQ [Virgibacillus phasianinus]